VGDNDVGCYVVGLLLHLGAIQQSGVINDLEVDDYAMFFLKGFDNFIDEVFCSRGGLNKREEKTKVLVATSTSSTTVTSFSTTTSSVTITSFSTSTVSTIFSP
jgi:hypothetical protein